MADTPGDWPWHVLNGEDLMAMLRRCHAGESPDDVYLEAYVNATRTETWPPVTDDDDCPE